MPEGPEVTILSQYLLLNIKNNILEKMEILKGKYYRKPMKNFELLSSKYKINNIDSKGKLMWFVLIDIITNKQVYITSHLGLEGEWKFGSSTENCNIKFTIYDEKTNEHKYLCFYDNLSFGNIEIYFDSKSLSDKINKLAPDSLKEDFSNSEFNELVITFLNKNKKRVDKNIMLTLMEQDKNSGIVSGIGNYLAAEILYNAKISPFRTVGSLSVPEIEILGKSIRYITKLAYYDNMSGYMELFGNFIKTHKNYVDNGILPNYHSDIHLKKNEKFIFNVYRKKTDSLGNVIDADKTIQKGRTTYWCPNVQQ